MVSKIRSAYGVDIKYRTRLLQVPGAHADDRAVRRAGQPGAQVRLHYVHPYPHVG